MGTRLLVCPLLFAFAFAWTAPAQTPPPEPKFAVELPVPEGSPPHYVTLRGNAPSSLFSDLSRLRKAGLKPEVRQPTALKLDYRVDGDLVQITAYVFFGDFDRQAGPESLLYLPGQKVCAYTAGLNESVTLSEMEEFGLQPLTLKVVSAKPDGSVRPMTMSKAPSVQIEIVDEDRSVYLVLLRNTSNKAVTGFCVDMPDKDGNQVFASPDDGSRSVIAPGATYQLRFGIPSSGRISNGIFVRNPPPPFLVLEAAFFEDGTYEGDSEVAAENAALRIGSAIQRQRITQLVEAILADAQSDDDDAKVTRILAEVAKLTEDPDPEMIEKVRRQFPGLSDRSIQSVTRNLKSAMNGAKQSLTAGLKEFDRGKANQRNLTLALWWGMQRKP